MSVGMAVFDGWEVLDVCRCGCVMDGRCWMSVGVAVFDGWEVLDVCRCGCV